MPSVALLNRGLSLSDMNTSEAEVSPSSNAWGSYPGVDAKTNTSPVSGLIPTTAPFMPPTNSLAFSWRDTSSTLNEVVAIDGYGIQVDGYIGFPSNMTEAADSNTPAFVNTPTGVSGTQVTWLKVYINGVESYIPVWQ